MGILDGNSEIGAHLNLIVIGGGGQNRPNGEKVLIQNLKKNF